jgi:hypothetical protein
LPADELAIVAQVNLYYHFQNADEIIHHFHFQDFEKKIDFGASQSLLMRQVA